MTGSMDRMNDTVARIAGDASAAAGSSDQARGKAEVGSSVVKNVIAAIALVDSKTESLKGSLNELGTRAEGIGRIMSVITDIADQTNLLALNAAIEAARAGEAGRGFAVVADEVRKLAEKTMQATKEVGDAVQAIQTGTQNNIRGMEETTAAVGESTRLAQEAGGALREIVDISALSAQQVKGIEHASEEQSKVSEYISTGATQIHAIAGNTASLMAKSRETVAVVSKLTGQINELVRELQKA